jgi:hypothetical protein
MGGFDLVVVGLRRVVVGLHERLFALPEPVVVDRQLNTPSRRTDVAIVVEEERIAGLPVPCPDVHLRLEGRTPQGAYLVYENGAERPAMLWLQKYVADRRPAVDAGQSFRIDGGTCNVIATVAASDPDAATRPELAMLQDWKILSGSGEGIFAVDPATGSISIAKPLGVDFTRSGYEIVLSVGDGFKSSEPQTVTITIPRKIDVVHKGHAINIAKQAVPAHLREHGDCLGTFGVQ